VVDDHARRIQELFARASSRYDLLNTLLSFGQDHRWRRLAVGSLGLPPGSWVLDVAAGTGGLTLEARRRGYRVVAVDFCPPMLRVARRRGVEGLVVGDALQLPFPSGSFQGATIGFGLRNLSDPRQGLAEMHRTLKPGGRAVVLEFCHPTRGAFPRLGWAYVRWVLPVLGGVLSGEPEAYSWLPRSIQSFPDPPGVCALMEEVGFREVGHRRLNLDLVAICWGTHR